MRFLLLAAFVLLFPGIAAAHHYMVGDLHVGHIWGLSGGKRVSGMQVYVPIENMGEADTLTSATTPKGTVTLEQAGKKVDHIDLAANKTSDLAPGGASIRVSGLKPALQDGDKFPLTLHFAKAGNLETEVHVQAHAGD